MHDFSHVPNPPQKKQEPFVLAVEMLPQIDPETFIPLGNRVIIRPIIAPPFKWKTGNLSVAEDTDNNIKHLTYNKGEVLCAGPTIEDKRLAPGAIVYFMRQQSEGGFRVGEKQEVLMYHEFNIIAVLDAEKEQEKMLLEQAKEIVA